MRTLDRTTLERFEPPHIAFRKLRAMRTLLPGSRFARVAGLGSKRMFHHCILHSDVDPDFEPVWFVPCHNLG